MESEPKICPTCGARYDGAAIFCQTDGSTLLADGEDPPDPYIGKVLLEQFKLEELIGVGGMGAVYRARQTTLDRDVAIKILHPDLTENPDAIRRFQREAKITTALDHPNVVNVFLFGQLPDGSLYLVMEYLQGRSLLDMIRTEGALDLRRALHIGIQICDGIAEAHAHGIVHRDVKPENVIVVQRGRDPDFVKVLDFGIARLLWDEQTVATQSGLIFGTARYISPEGAAGEATDSRSDVYSTGVLLYQLLVGSTPFEADSPVAMLMKHINETPSDIRTRGPVPDPVAEVVMRALDKDAGARFLDASDLAEQLRLAAMNVGLELPDSRYRLSATPSPDGLDYRRSSSGPPVATPSRASVQESYTLASAPDPFREATTASHVPGLRSGTGAGRLLTNVALAFAIGAGLVSGAAYFVGVFEPASNPAVANSRQPTSSAPPIHERESEASATPSEAGEETPVVPNAPEPGLRLLPESPVVGQPVTLIGVFGENLDVSPRPRVSFQIRRGRGASRAVPATLGPDGRSWLASFVFPTTGRFVVRLERSPRGMGPALETEVVVAGPTSRTDSEDSPALTRPAIVEEADRAANNPLVALPPAIGGDLESITEPPVEPPPDEGIDWTAPADPWPGAPPANARRAPRPPPIDEPPPPPWTSSGNEI